MLHSPWPWVLQQQSKSQKDQPFDCSQISAKGIDKQMNLHAALKFLADCGMTPTFRFRLRIGTSPLPMPTRNLLPMP